jgi:hypothetical protein
MVSATHVYADIKTPRESRAEPPLPPPPQPPLPDPVPPVPPPEVVYLYLADNSHT